MEHDLSYQTEPPNPYRDALVAGGIVGISLLPVIGGPIASAIDATLGHKQSRLVADGFTRVAARINDPEDRPTVEQMLASDEFTAACQAMIDATIRAASASKRARLAEALSRMGPWGPYDEEERAELFALVERYSDTHVFLLKFCADPRAWIQAQGTIREIDRVESTSMLTILAEYAFPGGINWQGRLQRVADELDRDGLVDGAQLANMSARSVVLTRKTTRLGDRFLRMISESTDETLE